MSKQVYVAMSGGVDSSLTAALLKDQGYKVTGVYMKNWTKDFPGFKCPWQDDYQDAKRVAVQLKIDFKVYDFETEYRHQVVDYMIKEYKEGNTPNPDIMCNQEVKFKLFLQCATKDGAKLIATGHYARTKGSYLYKGLDENKDQSYFLYRVDADAIKKSLMPIGNYHKSDVRKLAKKLNLVTAEKKDSQGICFVGKVGIKEFLLSELGPQKPGPIINQKGEEIGTHDGAIFYTIGQRHGLNLGGGLPYYVTKKDVKKNIVYVTTDLFDDNLWTSEVRLTQPHWINEAPTQNKTYTCRLRYRGPLLKAKVIKDKLVLDKPARGKAAGQSAVVYDGDEVIGGGIIR
ncbi:MAG TPA: tRNA 2-thiouridine(34) synthase MnmA [Candidatus Sulfotelmatobacter sp.]|nr:tRNA 2-thiouridine(34) synthase MnmA [Candidatus Sulfotelmatobacter sp.]